MGEECGHGETGELGGCPRVGGCPRGDYLKLRSSPIPSPVLTATCTFTRMYALQPRVPVVLALREGRGQLRPQGQSVEKAEVEALAR